MDDMVLSLPATEMQRLRAMNIGQLKQELLRSFEEIALQAVRMAWIIRILEEHGEDLSEYRIHNLPILRKIAYGQLVPDAYVRFCNKPMLLNKVATLPIPDQEKLARGEPVEMAILRNDGTSDHRMANPLEMEPDQIKQVFGPNRIRSVGEQILQLEAKRPLPEKRMLPKSDGSVPHWLRAALKSDGKIESGKIHWSPGERRVALTGEFTIPELLAVIEHIQKHETVEAN